MPYVLKMQDKIPKILTMVPTDQQGRFPMMLQVTKKVVMTPLMTYLRVLGQQYLSEMGAG